MKTAAKILWEKYCESELAILRPILTAHGYVLDDIQKHLAGERYLMQAVTTASGRKLILLGVDRDGSQVIIKATRDKDGIREIMHEEECRRVLHAIDFASEVFHTPERIDRILEQGFVIQVTRFIPQERTFLERPIEEQFSLALHAFKGQEGAHATTFKHRKLIGTTFNMRDAYTYLNTFSSFQEAIKKALPKNDALHTLLTNAKQVLTNHRENIEQYCGFLTHTDFVPHNIRIADNTIYLLDHSSLTFGNKYEGWARFLNFMTLYNQPLERAFVDYVQKNRTGEETISLRMMRIYRLGEIIRYYTRTLEASEGDLFTLNTERIRFWSGVLGCILNEADVPLSLIEDYKKTRDSLRSEDEKKRQQGLH